VQPARPFRYFLSGIAGFENLLTLGAVAGAAFGGIPMSNGKTILNAIRQHLNLTDYRKTHWEGSFDQYLDIVIKNPEVTRTAYQRLYDMILSHGVEEIYEQKEKVVRYKFFNDFATKHGDGIFGLDRQLVHLVNAFKSAAKGYGTEKRVLLLHGPVGSSKIFLLLEGR
jgi:serine protein kinase